MAVPSALGHVVQGVQEMQRPKGTRWVSATRMDATAACNMCDVYPETRKGRGATDKRRSVDKRRHALDNRLARHPRAAQSR